MTIANAASGAARASSDNRTEPPSSPVAMTGLPKPPVKTVDFALSIAVTPCVKLAVPPPAMTAAIHFAIGGRSVMTAFGDPDGLEVVDAPVPAGGPMYKHALSLLHSRHTMKELVCRHIGHAVAKLIAAHAITHKVDFPNDIIAHHERRPVAAASMRRWSANWAPLRSTTNTRISRVFCRAGSTLSSTASARTAIAALLQRLSAAGCSAPTATRRACRRSAAF